MIEVQRENFREFLDSEWASRYREALQQTISMVSVSCPDLPQYALVCLVQRRGQFTQDTRDVLRETSSQRFELTENPSEPRMKELGLLASLNILTFRQLPLRASL
jgi:hypothetical protein